MKLISPSTNPNPNPKSPVIVDLCLYFPPKHKGTRNQGQRALL